MVADTRLDAVRDRHQMNGERHARDDGSGDLEFACRAEKAQHDRAGRQREQRQGHHLRLERGAGEAFGRTRMDGVVLYDQAEVEAEMLDDAQGEHRRGVPRKARAMQKPAYSRPHRGFVRTGRVLLHSHPYRNAPPRAP